MKSCGVFLVALLAILFVLTDAGVNVEEEVYMKDSKHPTLISEEQVLKDLEAAKLEDVGFTRSEEKSIEIAKDGSRVEKRIIGYFKKVKCTKEKATRREIEERLPERLFSKDLNKDVDKEVETEETDHSMQECTVGIQAEVPRTGRKRFFFFGFSLSIAFGFIFG